MRVVITGAGAVSALGCGGQQMWDNLIQGKSGFAPITHFDPAQYTSKSGGEISYAKLQDILNGVSTNHYDAIQLITGAAAKLAFEHAGLTGGFYPAKELGIVLGSTYGYLDSVSKFYLEALRDGPANVSPIRFTNTVMNAAAGKISIQLKTTGLCSTVATGETSGLDALIYACDMLQSNCCKAILVGGGQSLNEGLFFGFSQSGSLAGASTKAGPELCCPFDSAAGGVILGEGAGIIVLESLEDARRRGAAILGEITGFASHFDPECTEASRIAGLAAVMAGAIERAGIRPAEVSAIMANACSDPVKDRIEALAIQNLFDPESQPWITAPKSMLGECLEGAAPLAAVAGLHSIAEQRIPPTLHLNNPLVPGLRYATEAVFDQVEHLLINACSASGQQTAVVLSRFTEAAG